MTESRGSKLEVAIDSLVLAGSERERERGNTHLTKNSILLQTQEALLGAQDL